MNRRDLLKAAPAALAVGAVPTNVAADTPTPMASLYRRWLEAKQAYNASDFPDGDAREAALYANVKAVEDEILAIRPQTAEDYAFKLIVLNDFAGIEGIPWGDAMLAEARALIAA